MSNNRRKWSLPHTLSLGFGAFVVVLIALPILLEAVLALTAHKITFDKPGDALVALQDYILAASGLLTSSVIFVTLFQWAEQRSNALPSIELVDVSIAIDETYSRRLLLNSPLRFRIVNAGFRTALIRRVDFTIDRSRTLYDSGGVLLRAGETLCLTSTDSLREIIGKQLEESGVVVSGNPMSASMEAALEPRRIATIREEEISRLKSLPESISKMKITVDVVYRDPHHIDPRQRGVDVPSPRSDFTPELGTIIQSHLSEVIYGVKRVEIEGPVMATMGS